MKTFATILCLFFPLILFADLQQHFKPASRKSLKNSYFNIDFIYMINLDQRPEKYEKTRKKFQTYGIFPYRFSAVNGWELTLDEINDIGVVYSPHMRKNIMGTSYLTKDFMPIHEKISNIGQTYFCHCMSRGAIGIILSHLSILQDAYDSGYKTIWILEDDIEIAADPRKIPHFINLLDETVGKKNWDILFTDRDTRNANGEDVPARGAALRPNFNPKKPNQYHTRKKNGKFMQVGARYGAYSMIIRRSGIKKLLNHFKKHQIFFPYDMEFMLPPGIKLYTLRHNIVTNDLEALSDNGGPNYLNAQ